jgi:hypothetical protein
MAERDPIDVIRDQLGQADSMGNLHADHEAFKQWHSETQTILEKCFSPKSVHCQNFLALKFREIAVKAFGSPEIDKINATRYRKDLETAKGLLHGAIKELTLDRTLFKKIPTTPRTVDVAFRGECFVSIGAADFQTAQAIEQAVEGTGLSLVWSDETSRKGEPLPQRIEKIRRARVGLFVVSPPAEADVLVELGIALGMGKEIWVFHGKDLPTSATLKALEPAEYASLLDLTEKIRKRVKGAK